MTDLAIAPTPTGFSPVDWVAVCRLDDLEPFWGEAALVADRQVALVRLPGDRVLAVGNIDPHTGAAVMSRGIVGSRGDRPTIASPLHKEVYDLETGERIGGDGPGLEVFAVRVVDGTVLVAIAGAAA